jgi:hypothetical protein
MTNANDAQDGPKNQAASKQRFAMLEQWQFERVRDADVGDSAAWLYAILALHADRETGECYPGMAKLAELAGKHKGNVKRMLRKLEAEGLIQTTRRASDFGDRDCNLYRLVGVGAPALPPGSASAPTVGAPALLPGGSAGAQGVGAPARPKQTIENRPSKQTKEREGARFMPPTVEQIREYCAERGNKVDAQQFMDHYTANGWRVGRNAMKDWRAAVRTWERNGIERSTGNGRQTKQQQRFAQQTYQGE